MATETKPAPPALALWNVRIFNGHTIDSPSTLVIDTNGLISDPSTASAAPRTIDCENNILLPGFIDAHVHLHSLDHLRTLARNGVTTALDMAMFPASEVAAFRAAYANATVADGEVMADFRTAGPCATVAGSTHSRLDGLPASSLLPLNDPETAVQWTRDRIAEGSDYIKVVADAPIGPDQSILDAIVRTAREDGKLSVAHAASALPFTMALRAGADIVTHVPLDEPLSAATAHQMAQAGTVAIPTLTMMIRMAKVRSRSYSNGRQSVRVLREAGVKILVGTDANTSQWAPVPYGPALHEELGLLAETGMSPVEILRAATEETAAVFNLRDRGVIEVGRRADLVLVEGDPTVNLGDANRVLRVWIKGRECKLVEEEGAEK